MATRLFLRSRAKSGSLFIILFAFEPESHQPLVLDHRVHYIRYDRLLVAKKRLNDWNSLRERSPDLGDLVVRKNHDVSNADKGAILGTAI